MHTQSRRRFLSFSVGTAATLSAMAGSRKLAAAPARKAQIAITLDLEMSRNFPSWETTHWDYEKGNLDEAAKAYSLSAARRVAEAGGRIHFFLVGRALEQANVEWLKKIYEDGHPIGNHTYDHVNVTATRTADVQFRFQRSPWLAHGMQPAELIENNVRLCTLAMRDRLGIEKPAGFRTPGGFADGLKNHPAVRAMLMSHGYRWVSSLYPPHPNTMPMQRPNADVISGIVAAQKLAQPFRYEDGLVELPMSPISDIGAFRNGRWELDWFIEVITRCLEWTIAERAAFDFLAHPSCLGVVDPHLKTIDRILDVVRNAGDAAELVTLDRLAERVNA